jgi:pyrroline-5-carboxylate reductase
MNILIIGGGHMGQTYARSFIRAHIASAGQLTILEKSPEKAESLAAAQIGRVFSRAEDCLSRADLIILAVKPQDSEALFQSIRPLLDPGQVLLSIMAGISIPTIREQLGVEKIIRAMPNLPAQIGRGMTVFTSSDEVTRIELVTVQNVLNATGKTLYVEREELLDAATAISGSGPAYVWFYMDALMEAARQMGFNEGEAELLVSQTFLGALELYQANNTSCPEWIRRVSSRGGTTEAALLVYRQTAFREDLIQGAQAALERARELGRHED